MQTICVGELLAGVHGGVGVGSLGVLISHYARQVGVTRGERLGSHPHLKTPGPPSHNLEGVLVLFALTINVLSVSALRCSQCVRSVHPCANLDQGAPGNGRDFSRFLYPLYFVTNASLSTKVHAFPEPGVHDGFRGQGRRPKEMQPWFGS